MITIDYIFNNIFVQHKGDLLDVIVSVDYTQKISNELSYYNISNVIELDEPTSDFVQFDSITHEQLVQWIEEKIFSGPNTRELFEMDANRVLASNPIMIKQLYS